MKFISTLLTVLTLCTPPSIAQANELRFPLVEDIHATVSEQEDPLRIQYRDTICRTRTGITVSRDSRLDFPIFITLQDGDGIMTKSSHNNNSRITLRAYGDFFSGWVSSHNICR